MKVVILGGAGMLGHKLVQTLGERFDDVSCTLRGKRDDPRYANVPLFEGEKVITDVDAADFGRLSSVLRELEPDVVINCVGIIKQRGDAKAAIPSITINALLPHELAAWAADWGGRVIHFSTDCVFNGKRGNYREDDLSDAEDLYGKSKFLGEVATDNALTIRTSIIGRELSSFHSLLEWFLSQRGKSIRGFKRVIYSGLTTNYLAHVVGDIVERHPTLNGLYQIASEPISKYVLLCMLRDAYGMEVDIQVDDETVSDRSLIGTRFASDTGIVTPPWNELVSELANDQTPYEAWRS